MFHWGVHGGFGYLTWTLSRELARRGHTVSVVTSRRRGQKPVEDVDGVRIIGFDPFDGYPQPLRGLASRYGSLRHYREADAEIYHSQAVSYNTYVAYKACPEKVHILTFQDPYDDDEWNRIAKVEPRYGSLGHRLRVRAEKRILGYTCRKMSALFAQAHFLKEKTVMLYGLRHEPKFLPNPVPIPEKLPSKSETPTVCFLARWDPQKRVELFFELAKRYPDVRFIAMGRSHDTVKDTWLRDNYNDVLNLVLTGFVSEDEKSRILGESWALVNTSIREALPVSFLEALAHETPIISGENPDQLTSTYGFHTQNDDYDSGIEWLLATDEWRRRGTAGRKHVSGVYEVGKVVDMHEKIYAELLGEKG